MLRAFQQKIAAIVGGVIDGATIGGTNPAAGNFTQLGVGTTSPTRKAEVSGTSETIARLVSTAATCNVRFVASGTSTGANEPKVGASGNNFIVTTGGSTSFMVDSVGNIRPATDGGGDNGTASARWDEVYAINGTIQTSDENEKQDFASISAAEKKAAVKAKAALKSFRWKSAVDEKGEDARIHFGIGAQTLKAIFESEGLDAGRYGMFISTTWYEAEVFVEAVEAQDATYDEKGNLLTEAIDAQEAFTFIDIKDSPAEGYTERTRLGVRYAELLAFIIAAI